MDDVLLNKLDILLNTLEGSEEVERFMYLKNKLMNDDKLLKEIQEVKNNNKDYISTKKNILDNKEFVEYKELEKRLYYLVNDINQRFSKLKVKHESN